MRANIPMIPLQHTVQLCPNLLPFVISSLQQSLKMRYGELGELRIIVYVISLIKVFPEEGSAIPKNEATVWPSDLVVSLSGTEADLSRIGILYPGLKHDSMNGR